MFVYFHGWYDDDYSVYLAMEYCDRGDLLHYIRQGLSEHDAQVIGKQLLEGLVRLHDHSWAHRDLKPQNIFVVQKSPSWWVKIGDFGISKRLRDDEYGTNVGTYGYMAPEADSRLDSEELITNTELESYQQQYKSGFAVDMWSLGCVLYQIPTNALPFPTDSSKELKKYIQNILPFPLDVLHAHNVSQEGCMFIQRLMEARPQNRLTARAALQKSWIMDADDYGASSGRERETSLGTGPQPELPDGPGVLQSSNPAVAADTTTTTSSITSVHPTSDDVTTGVEALRLGEQQSTERPERTARRISSQNGRTRGRSRSSSAESFYVVPNHGRSVTIGSPGRKKDYSPPTTVSNASQENNPRRPNQVQSSSDSPRHANDSSPSTTGPGTGREHNPKLGIALWNFVETAPNDLGLKQFDIVYNIRKKNSDWWHGTNESGEAGVFPSNYIGQTRLQAEALFDYSGKGSKDIKIVKGERITNIAISTPGWWTGTNRSGERGYFPGNYVKLDLDTIKEELNLERSVSDGRPRHATSPPVPNPRHNSTSHDGSLSNGHAHYKVGRAMKDFKAKNGTIAFEHGELITNIEVIPHLKHLIGTTASNQRGEIPRDIVDIAAETANSPHGWTSEDRWLARDRIPPQNAPRTGVEAVVVNQDQPEGDRGIAFDVGDEIFNIERSTLTWWFGRNNTKGVNGVFPKDMVRVKTDEDEQSDDDEARPNQAEAANSSSDQAADSSERIDSVERTSSVEPVASNPEQTSRRRGLFGRFMSRVPDQLGTSRSR